jgi:Rrf2 family transcriptional regulator, cysteine metabolism repressor
MKLSRTVVYAIQATLQLAQTEPNRPIPCRQVASRGNMPERFLAQILHSLVTHGVLESVHGPSGGYYLARAPDTITLLDIVELFDNPLEFGIPELPGVTAYVQKRLTETLRNTWAAARSELKKLTIADLSDDAIGSAGLLTHPQNSLQSATE